MRAIFHRFLYCLPYTAIAGVVIAAFALGRVGVIARPFGSQWDPAVVEHVVGGVALSLAVFGVFVVALLPESLDRWHGNAATAVLVTHSGILWGFHLWWEWNQGFGTFGAVIGYPASPRGHIQWDQVAADAAGIAIGFFLLQHRVRRMATPVAATAGVILT